MLHNEQLFAMADEHYEIRHDNGGNAIHVYIKGEEATVFPTLDDFVRGIYMHHITERFCCSVKDLAKLYLTDSYNYSRLKYRHATKNY